MSDGKSHTIGLTGSIGMGKSTVAGFFGEFGVAVWDADEAVHRLYDVGGECVAPIANLVPKAVSKGRVDRDALSAAIRKSSELLKKIEQIVHPLVAKDRENFREQTSAPFSLFDIPLLFEGSMDIQFDTIVVVSASADIQRTRVLARPGMTEEKFKFILSKQMPDEEKRKRADFVIETDVSFDDTRAQVKRILETLKLQ